MKNKDPRTGLDPPAGSDIPAPNALPKPGQPGAPAQTGQVSDDSTLPGLAPVGTPRVVAASVQIPQAGQALPAAPTAHIRPVPSDDSDSGTGGEDVLHRLAGAGLVVGGAALTAASAAGVLAGGVATAGTAGAASPLTVPEMAGAAAGITAGVGMMGTGMAMATEPSSSAGAIPHPRSEEPAAPEAAPLPDSTNTAPRPNSPDNPGDGGQSEPTKTDQIKEHLTPRDLDAARRELQGEVVARKSNGEPWDHVKEVRDAQNGLVNRISQLKKQLDDSRTTPEQRAAAQDELSEASKLLDRSEQFVPRESKGGN